MKKKHVFTLTFSLLLTFLLCSCSVGSFLKTILGKVFKNYSADAEEYAIMIEVLDAIQNRDEDALRKLFSKNTVAQVNGFDQSITDLFDYYQGNYISLDWKGASGAENWDFGERKKYISFSYDVKTNKTVFRFHIDYCSIDSLDDNNVGIYSLYIIKMEDDTDPEFAYGGDRKKTPGINIGIKNILPTIIDEPVQS